MGKRSAMPKKPPQAAFHSEINVTPLVDVCLVLLIIFMLVLPELLRGQNVELPHTNNHVVIQEAAKDKNIKWPVVAMKCVARGGDARFGCEKGEYFIEKTQMRDLSDLKANLTAELEKLRKKNAGQSKNVTMKIDVNLTYGQFYPFLIAIHDVTGRNVDLGTSDKKKAPKE
jgi:biopolymer transport protein ExbD